MAATQQNFVFLDTKTRRWQKIKKGLLSFLIFVDVLSILALFSTLSIPYLGPHSAEKTRQTPKEVIDFISTRKESVIEVVGHGPLVSLEMAENGPSLVRKEFQNEKIVILSFDDGPDPIFTPKILEVLKNENVKAVFFATGEQLIRHPYLAKEIIKGDHQIGTHTFSHPSEEINLYAQQNKMDFEFDFPQKIIEAQTGYKTKLFKVPNWGVEDTISLNSLILATYALDKGYTIISSTVDSFDWKETEKDSVVKNSVNLGSSQIILMHDGGGDRSTTIASLPEIIKRYKEEGYRFTTVDALLENDETAMLPAGVFEKIQAHVALTLFWLKVHFHSLLIPLFRLSLTMIGVSIFSTLTLSAIHVTQSYRNGGRNSAFTPFVSVLIPAFNEEKTIGKTIESLLDSHYPNFEIIVIDNNSNDKTHDVVKRFTNGRNVKLVKEKKQGKFAALNRGIKSSVGHILVMVDADTQVLPNAISELARPFRDERVGTVAGNLKVGNIINSLTAFQAVEYTVGLHLDRRAYDILGAVPIVPGALGAWRKKVIARVGGYQGDTLTEDADLTVRVQREGYKAVFAGEAVAYTEVPENLKAFLHQRLRWTLGVLQVLYKYRSMYFKREYGVLGVFVLPYLALIQLPLMLLAPIIDLLAVTFLLFISPFPIVNYFLAFLMLNFTITLIAFLFARESRIWLLAFLPIARIVYQGIWYYTLYRSVFTALKGLFIPWAKLTHRGSVSLDDIRKPAVVFAPEFAKKAKQ